MSPTRDEFVRVRRAAAAFHVLWWIDHDGKRFVLTCGEPNEDGFGLDYGRATHKTLQESQECAVEWHQDFMPSSPSANAPAVQFHYTAAARAAAGMDG